ncbi:MipA/OmpV family protein [Winogradskyella sp.]|uniref:MipA/OmpV family protein n=1 Tax=Winogradskyella sp. TaxID=1883156 RepID=UPI00262C0586|nr:MipA/OmpV family protein [Winogradskyella sp.]
MKFIRLIAFLIVLILDTVNETNAQTANTEAPIKKLNLFVGGGVALTQQYEGSNRFLTIPSLVVNASWISGQYIRLSPIGLDANILSNKNWEFGPRIRFILPRNDNIVDQAQVSQLEDLNFSTLLGLFGRYKFAKGFDLKIEYIHDIFGVSDGGFANLEFGYTLRKRRLITRFALLNSYATDNYMTTYFGVNAQNLGTSTLPNYNIEAGIKDVGFRITPTYIINQKWMLTGVLGFRRLLGDVADSPLIQVGSENQFIGGLAFLYRL